MMQERSNQYKKKTEAERKEYVERFLPDGFSYVGGYIDCEHDVTLRCDKCGAVFARSMETLRHPKGNVIRCRECEERKRRERAEEKARAKAERERQKQRRQADADTERFMNTLLVECSECGKVFATIDSRRVCCSRKCLKHRQNSRHDNRIAKDKRIDKDISVDRLFSRDKGRCWICGGECDKNDFVMKGETFVAGNNYPSIDHIVPVYLGGADSWENVRLAHRNCNLKRYLTEKLRPSRCETR